MNPNQVEIGSLLAAWPGWMLWAGAAAAVAILVFGAKNTVGFAVRLAKALAISPVVIGATVVSLGTTTPETFTSVTAAFLGESALALGNGVGSIICNAALIFGLTCFLSSVPRKQGIFARFGYLQLAAGLLLVIAVLVSAIVHGFSQPLLLPRWLGGVFLVLLAGYLYYQVKHRGEACAIAEGEGEEGLTIRLSERVPVLFLLGGMAVSLALVAGGSRLLVGVVSEISLRYRLPTDILAVTMVALSTSLPELAVGIAAIIHKRADISLGNVMGANVLNILLVIGASSAASSLRVAPQFLYLHLPVMLLILVAMMVFIGGKGKTFPRWQGGVLLGIYAAYVFILFSSLI